MFIKNKFKLNDFLLNIKLKKSVNSVLSFFLEIFNKANNKKISRYLRYYCNILFLNLLKFIINIKLKKSNIFMHIFDSLGNQIKFYSIASLLKLKKNKVKKSEILKTFYYILITKHYKLIKNAKIEIVLNKDLNFLVSFTEKIRRKFLLINLKFINNIPYNGCRRKKK